MTFEDLCDYVTSLKINNYHTHVMINTNWLQVENYIFYKDGRIEECIHHGIIARDMSYNQMSVKIDNLFKGIDNGK